MLKRWLIVAGCLGCGTVAALYPPAARAAWQSPGMPRQSSTCTSGTQSTSPALSAHPTSVTIGPTESSSIVLTLGAGCEPLCHVSLTLYRDGSFTDTVIRPFPAELDVGEVGTSVVMLTGRELGLITGSLTGLVTATEESDPPLQVATAVSISVTERPVGLPSLGTLTLPAAPASIDDQHPGVVVARVTNTTTIPITVDSLGPTSTDSITVTPDQPFTKFTLSPGESQDVDFIAKTSPNFQEGAHTISFRALISTPDGTRSQVLVSDKSVTVSVFGEAQITGAVGAVSFLFVPGLLILVVFKVLWEQYSPRHTLAWLSSKNPEFWVAVITLSLLVIPLYYYVTLLYGPGRNLVASYDSEDIVKLWVGSLVAGGVAWLVGLSVWTRHHIRPQDMAETVVHKLAKRRAPTLRVELADIKGQKGTFGIADRLKDVVVIPSIEYSSSPEIRGQADSAVNNDDAREFWRLARSGQVTVDFEDHRKVRELQSAEVQSRGQRGRIIIAAPRG
jgi:hypothetical protein